MRTVRTGYTRVPGNPGGLIRTLALLIVLYHAYGVYCSAKTIHVCMQCKEGKVKTIERAVRVAKSGDTILVHWEPDFPIFLDHAVIDKPITLTVAPGKSTLDDFDSHPIISPVGGYKEVIEITVPGVTISGLNITNFAGVSADSSDAEFDGEVGIRCSAPAVIQYCQFTKCSAAVLLQYDPGKFAVGSRIENCRIGYPTFEKWSPKRPKHPGNLTGVVILDPGCAASENPGIPDEIKACTITGNRYYGIVFAPGRKPVLKDNLIELNGLRPFRVAKCRLSADGGFIWLDK